MGMNYGPTRHIVVFASGEEYHYAKRYNADWFIRRSRRKVAYIINIKYKQFPMQEPHSYDYQDRNNYSTRQP